MKVFIFNEHHVCINPNIYFESGGFEQHYLIVSKTAKTPKGRWVYGISYNHMTGGGGCGCWENDTENYATEKEAGVAALKKIRGLFEGQIRWLSASPRAVSPDGTQVKNEVKMCRKAIEIIDGELKPKVEQLELEF